MRLEMVGNDGGNVSQDVLFRLRRDIVNGDLEPGAKLKFAELQAIYAVGIGTLREALSRLVTEGLATLDAGRGFRVAEVSEADLADLTSLRIDIERRAIEDSVRHGDDEWEAQVLASWHRLSKVSGLSAEERLKQFPEWMMRHRDFHAALVSACRSPRILQLRAILFAQAERYRLLSRQHAPKAQEKEHDELRDACLERDAKRAGDILVRHITVTAENVLRYSPQLSEKAATPPRRTRKAS